MGSAEWSKAANVPDMLNETGKTRGASKGGGKKEAGVWLNSNVTPACCCEGKNVSRYDNTMDDDCNQESLWERLQAFHNTTECSNTFVYVKKNSHYHKCHRITLKLNTSNIYICVPRTAQKRNTGFFHSFVNYPWCKNIRIFDLVMILKTYRFWLRWSIE